MPVPHTETDASKIGGQFPDRIQAGGDGCVFRAVVLLNVPATPPRTQRITPHQRAERVREVTARAAELLPDVDALLQQHQGQRLSTAPDLFGAVVVETTGAGIRALAASDAVRAIMEDQPVRLVSC